MIINIDEIPEEGLYLKGSEPAEILELKEEKFFAPLGDVRFDFYVQCVCDELIVNGSVQAEVQVQCSRCTQIFSTKIEDSAFLRTFPLMGGVYELDITEYIREAIVLDLPNFPLCDEACSGLCPHCGTNLNTGSCDCTEEEGPSAWDALGGLKF